MSAAIDRRLQHHLVTRILKLRSPPVMHLDRFGEEGEAIEKSLDLSGGQPRCETVVCKLARGFVFDQQSGAQQERPPPLPDRSQTAADAPVGLRNAATMTSVSRTTLTSHIMSYRKFYAKLDDGIWRATPPAATQGDGGSFVAPAGWYWYSRSMEHGQATEVAGGDRMNDVTKGFRDQRFLSLSERESGTSSS